MKKLSNDEKKEKVRQRVVILLASIDQFSINTLKHVDSIALDELAHAKDMIYERLNNAFDRMERMIDAKNQTEFTFDRPAIAHKLPLTSEEMIGVSVVETSPCRLSLAQVKKIRDSKEPQNILAEKYRVDPSYISRIKSKQVWS